MTWDLTTNETDILVPHELLTSFSSGAQFKGFSPDQVGYDWRTLGHVTSILLSDWTRRCSCLHSTSRQCGGTPSRRPTWCTGEL